MDKDYVRRMEQPEKLRYRIVSKARSSKKVTKIIWFPVTQWLPSFLNRRRVEEAKSYVQLAAQQGKDLAEVTKNLTATVAELILD